MTEPENLRDGTFEERFAQVVLLLRTSGGIEGLLVHDGVPGWTLGDRPFMEFYGAGSVALGFDDLGRDAVLIYSERPSGNGSDFVKDFAVARLLDAMHAVEDAAGEEGRCRARQARTYWAYHAASLIALGEDLASLLGKFVNGDDEALMAVLRLDKTAIMLPRVRGRVVEAQRAGDWSFFERLGKAIASPPLGENPYMFDVEVLASVFWDWRLRHLSYSKITALLVEHGVIPATTDPQSLRKMLNRMGFTKIRNE